MSRLPFPRIHAQLGAVCRECSGIGTVEGVECVHCLGTGNLYEAACRRAYRAGQQDVLDRLGPIARMLVAAAEGQLEEPSTDELRRIVGGK